MTDLERFRDHARKMSAEPSQTPAEQRLWTQLADEVDDYLADDQPEETGLFLLAVPDST